MVLEKGIVLESTAESDGIEDERRLGHLSAGTLSQIEVRHITERESVNTMSKKNT